MTEVRTTTISRRTLAKGAAWSAPVVALGAATPAFATSGPPPTGVALSTCKQPGSSCNPIVKGYLFKLTVSNTNSTLPIWAYSSASDGPIITETLNPDLDPQYAGAYVGTTWYPAGTNIPILAGATITIILNASAASSANEAIQGTITVFWGHTADHADDTDHDANPIVIPYDFTATPPCDNCTV